DHHSGDDRGHREDVESELAAQQRTHHADGLPGGHRERVGTEQPLHEPAGAGERQEGTNKPYGNGEGGRLVPSCEVNDEEHATIVPRLSMAHTMSRYLPR